LFFLYYYYIYFYIYNFNLIFTLENIETHYIIFCADIFYCYKCYEEEPKNEEDIKLFCDYDNLHRNIHSNDLNKRIKLEYGTEKAKIN